MFIIKKEQLKAFEKKSYESFIVKSLEFLETNFESWTRGQDEYDLRIFIEETILLGEKIGVRQEVSVQKLMVIKVKYEEVDLNLFLGEEYVGLRNQTDEEFKIKLIHREVITIHKQNNNTNENA